MKMNISHSKRLYLIGILLIGLLTTLGHLTAMRMTSQDGVYSSAINLAGRQRMLSQRIALYAQTQMHEPTASSWADLALAVKEMRTAHEALSTGGEHTSLSGAAPMNDRIRNVYGGETALGTQVVLYLQRADKILSGYRTNEADLDYLLAESNGDLLSGLELAVNTYEWNADDSATLSGQIETGLWLATLVMLVLEWFLIFRPQNRRLAAAFELVTEQMDELARVHRRSLLAGKIVRTGILDQPDITQDRVMLTPSFIQALRYENDAAENIVPDLLEHVHQQDWEKVRELLKSHTDTQVHISIDVRLRCANGEYRWFALTSEVRNSGNDPERLRRLMVVCDIHERKQSEQIKSEFISTVNHELRTPLTSIVGALRLIASGATGKLPEPAQRLAQIALTSSKRLNALINDLLDMEQLNRQDMKIEMSPCRLPDLLQTSLRVHEESAVEKRLSIQLNYDIPPETLIRVDPDRFGQVVGNILSNAIKFSPEGADILVTATADQGRAIISVRDFGPGIPKDFIPRLFERFAQADSSATRQHEGTGLGLSISKALVEAFEGELWYEPATGGGAIFLISLPRLAAETPTLAATA